MAKILEIEKQGIVTQQLITDKFANYLRLRGCFEFQGKYLITQSRLHILCTRFLNAKNNSIQDILEKPKVFDKKHERRKEQKQLLFIERRAFVHCYE